MSEQTKQSRTPATVLGHLSTGTRLARLLWQAVWLLLYRPSPAPLHAWRCFLLKVFGARIGRGAHPYPSARIWAPWQLEMGKGSCIGPECDIYNVAMVRIGEKAIISQKCYVCTASHDFRNPGFALTAAPVSIGRMAWVAADAFVGPGVAIGDGAVVAARAVVIRNVAVNAVVGGNPAQVIGETSLAEFDLGEEAPRMR